MSRKSLLGSLLVGAAAGAAGTAAMNGYWAALQQLGWGSPTAGLKKGEEPATAKVARDLLGLLCIREPSKAACRSAGRGVHWAFGTSWGVLAAGARHAGLRADTCAGQPLGAALWALGDLWMLHQLGYARHPRAYPTRLHAEALGAHLAYGLGVWAVLEVASRLSRCEIAEDAGLPRVA